MQLKDPSLLVQRCLINGEWVASSATIAVRNPATGATVGAVPQLGREHTQQAIDAAERARKPWAARTAKDRATVLERWAALVEAAADDLAQIMTAEQGKPLKEARGEILYAASFLKWFAEEGKRAYGDIIPAHAPDKRIVVIKQPVGVCAAITPWNFPAAMVTRKAGPASPQAAAWC